MEGLNDIARAQGLAFHKLSMSGCQLRVGGLLQAQAVTGLSLDIPSAEGEEKKSNSRGISTKHLVDLQRFIACRKVMQQEHLVNSDVVEELKVVVAHSKIMSARLNLLVRSSQQFRPASHH